MRTMKNNILRIFISVLPILISTMTSSSGADDQNDAKRAFENGVAHFSAGDYESAEAAFKRSYALSPRPIVLFNLAMSQKAQKKKVAAIATFEQYLSLDGDAEDPARVEQAKLSLAELTEQDDASFPTEASDETSHTPIESAADTTTAPESSTKRGEQVETAIEVEDISSSNKKKIDSFDSVEKASFSSLDSPKTTERFSRRRKIGFIIGAVSCGALAATGIGIGSYFAYLRETSDLVDARTADSLDEYNSIRARGNAHVAGAIASFTSAGIFIAGGIALMIVNRKQLGHLKNHDLELSFSGKGLSIVY